MSQDIPSRITCPSCNSTALRFWNVPYVGKVMHEHFNNSVGRPISDRRQFRRVLKENGEKETERTGTLHSFVEADPTDRESLGVTEEGLDTTFADRKRRGLPNPKL